MAQAAMPGERSYGDVWLEVMEDEPSMKRAVKAIRMNEMGVDVDYTKEVKAMVEFSKAKVRLTTVTFSHVVLY